MGECHVSPLLRCKTMIVNILILLGIDMDQLYINHKVKGDGKGTQETSDLTTNSFFQDEIMIHELISSILDTRKHLKKLVLEKHKMKKTEIGRDLLKISDLLRDQCLMKLGIEVHDFVNFDSKYDIKTGLKIQAINSIEKENRFSALYETDKDILPKQSEKRDNEINIQGLKADPSKTFSIGIYKDMYSRFDDRGIPTHDKTGTELSKAKRKKLEKKFLKTLKQINKDA